MSCGLAPVISLIKAMRPGYVLPNMDTYMDTYITKHAKVKRQYESNSATYMLKSDIRRLVSCQFKNVYQATYVLRSTAV
jgi:hypothetical protein